MRGLRTAISDDVPWSSASTTKVDWSLHQIAPYIGRLKPSIAAHLIERFSRPDDLIIDPFCGSGVIPLEAAARGRRVLAADHNPYAVTLTRAKLHPPTTLQGALRRLDGVANHARERTNHQDLRKVPAWVRAYFHPETLREALAYRDACVERRQPFLLACLLGILHHQRPGFLSYPSSHLVPYLRDKKYPRARFPEMYEYRELYSRLEAKIQRTFKRVPDLSGASLVVRRSDARSLTIPEEAGAVITSPPYMNELDYVRDNRLRLWFINRSLPTTQDVRRAGREIKFEALLRTVIRRVAPATRVNGHIVLIVGDVGRNRKRESTLPIVERILSTVPELKPFDLTELYEDSIPDVRRSRRTCRGTRREWMVVLRRSRRKS